MKRTTSHLLNILVLALGLWVGFWGIGLFKSFYKDFSLTDFSYQRLIIPHVGGALLMAAATYLIVWSFIRLKRGL